MVAKKQLHDSRRGEIALPPPPPLFAHPSTGTISRQPDSARIQIIRKHKMQRAQYRCKPPQPAYCPPLSSSWHGQLMSSSSQSQLPLKSTQVLRQTLAGAGSDLGSPKPGGDSVLKRTPPPNLADVALVSPMALGCQRAPVPFAGLSSHAASLLRPQALPPGPQHPAKRHRSGQGWSRAHSGHRRES